MTTAMVKVLERKMVLESLQAVDDLWSEHLDAVYAGFRSHDMFRCGVCKAYSRQQLDLQYKLS